MNALGYVYSVNNKIFKAEAAYKMAILIDSENIFSHLNLGILKINQGNYQEALILLENAAILSINENDYKRYLMIISKIETLKIYQIEVASVLEKLEKLNTWGVLDDMNKKITVLLTFLCFLAACASPSGPELIAQNMQEKEEQKAEQIETNVENVPKWYLAPPDGKGVVGYFVGQGESPSIQVAKDIAIQEAKEDMASAIDSRLSQTIKKFIDQVELQQTLHLWESFLQSLKRLQLKHKWLGGHLKKEMFKQLMMAIYFMPL